MRALNLISLGNFEVEEREIPLPRENEVLLKVKACGICGSDIPRAFSSGPYHFPLVLGHEFSGEIIEIGDKVDEALVGKKAAVFPLLPCGKCIYCQHQMYARCQKYSYFGSRQDGGFQEYLTIPTFNLILLEDNVSYEEAAMIEPLTVAQHVVNTAKVKLNEKIMIYGAGPIGLLVGRWALLNGCSDVYFVDIDPKKIEFAKKIGFKNIINSSEFDPIEWIKEQTNGLGADIVVEGTGSENGLINSLESIRVEGRVVLLGNPHGDFNISRIVYDKFMRKEGSIHGIFNSVYSDFPKDEWTTSANMLADDKIKVKDLITHRVGIEEMDAMFKIIKNKEEFYCKSLMIND